MYIHNPLFGAGTSLHVSINSTNEYMATACVNGNITIRSMLKISQLYDNPITTETENDEADLTKKLESSLSPSLNNEVTSDSSKITAPLRQITKTPKFDEQKLKDAEQIVNIVNVRSRSKITCLKYANLLNNTNLLAAVYKNGEVYIITNPQDGNKCRIQHIFKHANGLLLDFCWSADDQIMAFSSMNNEVILYDVIYGKIISNLHLHENLQLNTTKDGTPEIVSVPIKGLCFDKLCNKYLITLGDDKTMQIIEYELVNDEYLGRRFNYKIVRTFAHIIASAKLNKASIKKISISPDDKLISLPNTSKSKAMRLSLINFDINDKIWKFQKELLANGFKCFSTLFSPIAYKNEKKETVYIIAALSTDSALSIWKTDCTTPIYVIPDLPSISDYCFSADGNMIFLTPYNGSLITGVFKQGEFGEIAFTNIELSKELHKKTSTSLPLEFEKMNKWRSFAADYPNLVKQKEIEMLETEKKKIKVKLAKDNNLKSEKSKTSTVNSNSSSNPKTETKTSDTVKNSDSNSKTNAKENKTTIKNNNNVPKNVTENSSKTQNLKLRCPDNNNVTILPKKLNENKPSIPAKRGLVKDDKDKNIEEKEKESKKQKTNNNNNSNSNNSNSDNNSNSKNSVNNTTSKKVADIESKEMKAKNSSKESNNKQKKLSTNSSNYEVPLTTVPKDLNMKVNKLIKKSLALQSNTENLNSNSNASLTLSTQKKKKDIDQVEFIGSIIINPQLSFSNVRIGIPKLRNNFQFKIPDQKSLYIDINNGNGLESQPTRLSFNKLINEKESKQLFVDFMPSKIHIACGSEQFLAISTINGQIITYSLNGRRILPVIVLGSTLSFLEMKNHFLMAVTNIGELYVWDLNMKKSLFKPALLFPLLQPIYSNLAYNSDQNIVSINGELLTRSENLTICSITSTGIPIVTLNNGNGYLFNKDMNSWSLISDSWWAFGSQYWDSTMNFEGGKKDFNLLEFLECHTNEEIHKRGKIKFFTKISKMMLMREGYENLETVISLNHLENKINFYNYLKDFDNFKKKLIIYCKKLSELNLKNRLIEILSNLFINMEETICGNHSKKQLLEDLLLNCAKHREVQNILIQYSESIGLLKDTDDSDLDIL